MFHRRGRCYVNEPLGKEHKPINRKSFCQDSYSISAFAFSTVVSFKTLLIDFLSSRSSHNQLLLSYKYFSSIEYNNNNNGDDDDDDKKPHHTDIEPNLIKFHRRRRLLTNAFGEYIEM